MQISSTRGVQVRNFDSLDIDGFEGPDEAGFVRPSDVQV